MFIIPHGAPEGYEWFGLYFAVRNLMRARRRFCAPVARTELACVHETIRPSSCSRARVGVPTYVSSTSSSARAAATMTESHLWFIASFVMTLLTAGGAYALGYWRGLHHGFKRGFEEGSQDGWERRFRGREQFRMRS
jgi:hypothetical protein